MPPLRDRLDDIPLLVDFYVKKIGKRLGRTIETIPAGVIDALQDYSWPGNVRELENILERAVTTSPAHTLRLVEEPRKPIKNPGRILKTLEAVERDYIIQVLGHTQWKVSGKTVLLKSLVSTGAHCGLACASSISKNRWSTECRCVPLHSRLDDVDHALNKAARSCWGRPYTNITTQILNRF